MSLNRREKRERFIELMLVSLWRTNHRKRTIVWYVQNLNLLQLLREYKSIQPRRISFSFWISYLQNC